MPRLALLPLLGLVVASCTPSAELPASTTTPVTTAPPSTTTTLGPSESLAAFVDCLQGAGLLVDPPTGSDLSDDLSAIAAALDTSDPEAQAAVGECAALLTVVQRTELAADPEVRRLVVAQLQAFAACMRSEGIDAFPDPSDGTLPEFDSTAIPFDDEGFEAALEECRDLIGGFGLEGRAPDSALF